MEDASEPHPPPVEAPPAPQRPKPWAWVALWLAGLAALGVVHRSLATHEDREMTHVAGLVGLHVADALVVRSRRVVQTLERTAALWEEQGGTREAEWRADARFLLERQPDLVALAVFGPDGGTRWVETDDGTGAPDLRGAPALTEAAVAAARSGEPTLTRTFPLPDGRVAFAAVIPLGDAAADGLLAGFVDVRELVRQVEAAELHFHVEVAEEGRPLYVSETPALEPCTEHAIQIGDALWTVRACPTGEIGTRMRSDMPGMLLAGGVVVLTMAAWLAWQRENLSWRAAQAEAARRDADRLVEDLRCSALQREAAFKELEGMSYTMAHDLRAPLRAMDGFSGLLEQEYAEKLDDRARGWLVRVRTNARTMARLIDDLLELSRVSRAPVARQRVDVCAMARDVGDALAERTGRRVALSVEEGIVADADPALLRRALEQLLDNAWKFTRGRAEPRVEVRHAVVSGRPGFLVKDNGVGFDVRYTKKLFAPFERLHGGEYEGTGMGLAIVDRIVRRHDGVIEAEGTVGEGAEIRIAL